MRVIPFLKAKKGQVVVLILALCLFILTACSGELEVTPAASAGGHLEAVSTVASVSKEATPVSTISSAVSAAGKVAVVNNQAQNIAVKPSSVEKAVVPELNYTSGFYKFPYANSEYFVHLPPHLQPNHPLQVVVAVHGMGGNGSSFGQPLISYADESGFALVAPTMKYDNNYFDPNIVASNDGHLLPELHQLIHSLPAQLHHSVRSKVLLFGFSRGSQIVHRYAFFYPQDVLGVAAMSAGSYTLPEQSYQATTNAAKTTLKFPFGLSDLSAYTGTAIDLQAIRQIPFWLGVGGADNTKTGVPPAWTPYQGSTRLERAQRFYKILQNEGINATLTIFPGVGHAVCTGMKQDAFSFFNRLAAETGQA
ncbi:MAG TPA: hypothetical protein VH186_20770 [Chloroflexia bacterium]|nr:hypothetical protein [Chloroflexia bacterium]